MGVLDDNIRFLKQWKFVIAACINSLSKSIINIKYDLPFCFTEYDGMNETNKVLNLDFVSIRRNTVTSQNLRTK